MAVYLGNKIVSGAAIGLGSTNSIIRPLPEEYQEVEWIGTNKDAYLITDFIPKVGDEIYLELMFQQTGSITQFSSENSTYMCGMMDDYYKYFTTGSASQFTPPLLDRWYEIRFSNTGLQLRINKTTIGSASQDSETPKAKGETDAPLHIFHRASNNQIAKSRMKYIRFKRRGEYVFNAIPCYRKSDNVIGMYDLANDVFYTNQGTGTFSKGVDMIREKFDRPFQSNSYKAYYIEYDRNKADYKLSYIQDIHPGDVITLKPGEDVAANYVGTPDENPDLTFQHWSCPIEQIDGKITIPYRVDCDLYIGAVYVPTDGQTHTINDVFGEPCRLYCNGSLPFYVQGKHSYKIVMVSESSWDNQSCFNSDNMEFFIQPQGRQFNSMLDGGRRFRYYVMPWGITSAPEIKYCRSLESVWIPDSVTSIGGDRFIKMQCKQLHLPLSLDALTGTCFDCEMESDRNHTPIDRIVIDCNITEIPDPSFRWQCARVFALASNITSIGGLTFDAARFAVIICNATTPPSLGKASTASYTKRVYVPVGTIPAYEAATNWSAYAGKFIEYTRANCESNGDEYIELR